MLTKKMSEGILNSKIKNIFSKIFGKQIQETFVSEPQIVEEKNHVDIFGPLANPSSCDKAYLSIKTKYKELVELNEKIKQDKFPEDLIFDLKLIIQNVKLWLELEAFDHHYELIGQLYRMILDCENRLNQPGLWEKTKAY